MVFGSLICKKKRQKPARRCGPEPSLLHKILICDQVLLMACLNYAGYNGSGKFLWVLLYRWLEINAIGVHYLSVGVSLL